MPTAIWSREPPDGQDRQPKAPGSWSLPVFLVVAFSAVLPLMTVVNYSVQDTFGNNQFFWNGVGWFKELLDPSTDLGGRFLASLGRNLLFSVVILAIEVPLGIVVALSMPREGWTVAACLVIMALPLLIPWNVVGTIWQIFARSDIGLLGYTLNAHRHRLQLRLQRRSPPGSPSSSWTSGTGPAWSRCSAMPA